MHYYKYPESLTDAALCAREIAVLVRSGEIAEKRKELGACLFTVQGTAMFYVLGSPTELSPIGATPLTDDCKAAFGELRDECQAALAAPQAVGAGPLDAIIKMMIAQLLEWLNAWLGS